MDADVIVVGAGPAGSALACRLRPACRVLVLERSAASVLASPRIGESLPGAARVLLQRFGVFERFLSSAHTERGATVSVWDRPEAVWFDQLRDPNGPGWHLDRTRFDACLRVAAQEAGASFMDSCGALRVSRALDGGFVVADALGRTHCAKVLVDASGRSAAIARQLGLERRAEDALVCLYTHLPVNAADEDSCTRIGADVNGWWYSVRVPSGRRVLAFHLDADDPELKTLREPGKLLAKARRHALLKEALPDAVTAQVHARVAGSAVLDMDSLAALPGFFAIGDALMAFDPIASQGIFHALASAESAASAIEQQCAGVASARAAFVTEMRVVHVRYREQLRATYAGPALRLNTRFWSRRSGGQQGTRTLQLRGAHW
jgi:flavin-dependent dehydrogenase